LGQPHKRRSAEEVEPDDNNHPEKDGIEPGWAMREEVHGLGRAEELI
jgi:hypothetical protein